MVDSDEFETKSEDEDEDLCHVPQTQQQQQQQQIGPVLQQQQRKRYGESERPNGKKHKTEEVKLVQVFIFFGKKLMKKIRKNWFVQ